MNQLLGFLVRSTGIVAAILLVLALLWGFLFSARSTGTRRRPAWWLDLHNWLGGASLAFTGLHILATLLQSDSGVGVLEVFVPTGDNWPIAWGVIATYLLMLTVFTTWPKRLGNRTLWRWLHLTSVGAAVLALLHSYQSGTDSSRVTFQTGVAILGGITVYGVGLRVFALIDRRRNEG